MNDIKDSFKRKIDQLLGKNESSAGHESNLTLGLSEVLSVPCDLIRPNRSQPRADFDEDELFKLASSIKRYGIIQPLVLRKAEIDDIYDYELISGERRLRAARLLGLYCVPCVVLDADEQTSAELAIIENIMRSDLNMFETAYALRNLSEDYGLTQEEIARRMSMSQSTVANKIRLLRLTYDEQQSILALELSERHARALLKLEDKEQRMAAIRHISDMHMNVKDAELYIDGLSRQNQDDIKADEVDTINDKTTGAVIRGIQKRIDNLAKSGRNAGMKVEFFEEHVELHIRIEK